MNEKNNNKGETKMRKLTINPMYTKTYKTVENLEKALDKLTKKLGLPHLTYLQCEVDGRFTAVFTDLARNDNGMYISALAHNGFKVVG